MASRSTRFSLELLIEDLGEVSPVALDTKVEEWNPFFRANWRNSGSVRVSQSWLTDVTKSKDGLIEERCALYDRPIRNFDVELSALNKESSIRLQNFLLRAGTTNHPMPIHPDRIRVYQQSAAGTNILFARVEWNRFFKGQRIALVKSDFGPWSDGDTKFYEIDYITQDAIFLKSNLDETIDALTYVYPMVDCELIENSEGIVLNDQVSTYSVRYQEKNGPSTLPPSWIGDVEVAVPYAYGYPIFTFKPNFALQAGQSLVRAMQRNRSGRAVSIDPDGTRPYIQYQFTVATKSRKAAWDVLRFFDSRQGRCRPFFLSSPLDLIDYSSIASDRITLNDNGRLEDFSEFYKYITIYYSDGTLEIRKLASQTGNELYFDSAISDISEVKKATFCYFGRFDSDILTQVWRTDHYSETSFTFKELEQEYNG